MVHYARAMRFQVLGPLEVETDDRAVVLGGPKERLLLALLLTRPNQVAPVEALIRGLWGEQPPRTAATSPPTPAPARVRAPPTPHFAGPGPMPTLRGAVRPRQFQPPE